MNAVRRFLSLFRNSPTYGRDQASLISGWNIGLAGLVLNGAVLLTLLPLMLDPNDPDWQMLTERMEFGQILALILLGGATAFATLLIPMRLAGVFMGPRIGRYFDQIVLSGITPLRFLIGKVTSQNLFLALMLFLLLPWFVLVLALGGLQWSTIIASLFLVWLYCMMLAVLMLWLSLYFNEVLAMLLVVGGGMFLCMLGCAPIPYQPFVLTPFPALLQGVYSASGMIEDEYFRSFSSVFTSCALAMLTVTVLALVSIAVGPLYGIIRDNSTFGEVVRAGDSKRKRRFRFRLHIQRPSELAFFYENRGDTFRRFEGLLRWGTGFILLLLPAALVWSVFISAIGQFVKTTSAGGGIYGWFFAELMTACHVIHGITVLIAILLFSHARNTTYLRVPVIRGWKVSVSAMDSFCFVLVLLLSTGVTLGFPEWFRSSVVVPAGISDAPASYNYSRITIANFVLEGCKGTIVLSLAGATMYLMQRTLCLTMWMKSISFFLVSVLYGVLLCGLPLAWGVMTSEVYELREYQLLYRSGPSIAAASPATILGTLYEGRPQTFPYDPPFAVFYVLHGGLILICVFLFRRLSRKLRLEYLNASAKENS
jgi:hypothetical protein